MEIEFNNPEYLILLVCIPLLIISHYYFLRHTKRKAMKFANFEALKRVSGKRLLTKNLFLLFLRLITISLLIVGIAGPVLWYSGKSDANNIIIAIDTSASMTAVDILPDRFNAAKGLAYTLIDNIGEDTNIGVVSFSGAAFIDGQLTDDSAYLKRLINDIEIGLSGGTDIGGAIITSVNLLIPGNRPGAILLMSDGTNTVGQSIDDDIQAGIDYAKKNKVKVYTVGIGSDAGMAEYVREELDIPAGYNMEALKSIASQTGGRFTEYLAAEDTEEFLENVRGVKENAYIPLELGFGLITVSLILLFVEWGLVNTRFRAIP